MNSEEFTFYAGKFVKLLSQILYTTKHCEPGHVETYALDVTYVLQNSVYNWLLICSVLGSFMKKIMKKKYNSAHLPHYFNDRIFLVSDLTSYLNLSPTNNYVDTFWEVQSGSTRVVSITKSSLKTKKCRGQINANLELLII